MKNELVTKIKLSKHEAQMLLFKQMLNMTNRELETVLYYLDNGKTEEGFEIIDTQAE